MKILKNKKAAAAVLLCAMLASGQSAMALEANAPNGAWTVPQLRAIQNTETVSFVEGTVEEFAVDDQGRTVWLLRRTGDEQSAPLIQVAVTSSTKVETKDSVANGSVIGVEYRGREDAVSLVADRVTQANPLPQITVSGQVVELMNQMDSTAGFLLREFSDDPAAAQEYIFRWDAAGNETKMLLADRSVDQGDRITVTYNGILTRSLPPQGFALAIADADAPAGR